MMAADSASLPSAPPAGASRARALLWLGHAEALAIPLLALLVSALLFSVFLLMLGKSPVQFFQLVWLGGFGTAFSWSNTLLRAATLGASEVLSLEDLSAMAPRQTVAASAD